MTTVKEMDLISEHEKAKANLVMLENLLQMAQQMEKQKLSDSKNEAEIEELSTKFNAARTELEKLKISLTKEEEEHTLKAAVWKGNNDNLQHILFKAETLSTASSENDDDLEEAVQLAQENAALFKQKLTIRQLSSNIKAKSPEIESLEASLSKKEELHSVVKNQLETSTEEFYKCKEKYCQKLEAEFNSNSVVVSLNSQLKRLNTDALGKERTIKAQNTKIVELEATIKSKNETIDVQQAIIAPLCSEFDLPAPNSEKPVETQLEDAYQKGRNAVFNMLGPLARAGRFIRSRKLEWERGTKDQKLVELGNKASHYGMALADAVLYQSFCPNKRKDPEIYISFYGLHPDFVWKNQDCTLLLDILDWRGAMKDFYPPKSHHRTAYPETTFCKLCNVFMASINAELTAWTVASLNNYLENIDKGAQMYKDLKAHHAAGLKVHETYLKNK
jgi:hypothetical protein